MILKRNGREVDELNFVKSSDAMLRMQKIADKLINYTPEINKCILNTLSIYFNMA